MSTGKPAGLDFLGMTCDVLSGFFPLSDDNIPTIREAVLGIATPKEMAGDIPVGVTKKDLKQTSGDTARGSSKAAYSKSLGDEAGVDVAYGAFSGSVSITYKSTVSAVEEEYYSTILDTAYTFSLRFDYREVDKTQGDLSHTDDALCLNQGLLDDFGKLDPKDNGESAIDFFGKWGTHVICWTLAGGQATYSSSGSSSDFSDEDSYVVAAKAKYASASGSATFSASTESATDNEQENVQEATSVRLRGGDSKKQDAALAAGTPDSFQAWLDSVPGNEECIGFNQTDGLVPLSEFCPDGDRQAYLETVWGRLSGTKPILPSFAEADQEMHECTDGAESGSFHAKWTDRYDNKHTQRWSAGDGEVLVGWGGHIDGNHHINRMVCVTLNMRTGEYSVHPPPDQIDYETTIWGSFFMAPAGHVITGLGVAQKDTSFYSLHVWYQRLNPYTLDSDNLLDGEILGAVCPTVTHHALDLSNLQSNWSAHGGGGIDSELNRFYRPEVDNQKIITGISIHATDSSNPHKGFDYMVLTRSNMRMPG